ERKDEKSEHRQNGNDQQHSKDCDSQVYFPIHGGTVRIQTQKACRLQREKEKRCVVGDRRDVVVVASRESFRVVALDQSRESIGFGFRRRIEESQVFVVTQVLPDRFLFFSRKRTLLRKNGNRDSVFIEFAIRHDDEMRRHILDAKLV